MESLMNFFTISNTELFLLFGKAFAVLFSFLYLVYAVVLTRQTQIMNKTYQTENSAILLFISFVQVFFAAILIIVSVTLI